MAIADRLFVVAILGSFATPMPVDAADLPVDLELVLAVDASPSIGLSEFFVQRRGYVAAFRDSQLVDAIRKGQHGRVAVTYMEWAGPTSQRVTVPWTLIDNAESAAGFASSLETAMSYSRLGTSISGALAYASWLFDQNGYAGEHQAIDVSGDGPNAVGPPLLAARDAVVARGITINGLPVMLSPARASLDDYYRDCVIGGPGAFIVSVERLADFETAIRSKIIMEIAARQTESPFRVLRASAVGDSCDD